MEVLKRRESQKVEQAAGLGMVILNFLLELVKFPIRYTFHRVRKGVILASRPSSMKAHQ